jgi:queuine tRNA-ribosyltransferase
MLPRDRPRYLMGVGTPSDLLAAIAMGFDMFDCVLPTRNARNGMAFTSRGPVSIKRAAHLRDTRPLDEKCDCRMCRTHSRAYLRHLFVSGEILAARALTEHNLHFYARLMRDSRAAIASGNFTAYAKEVSGGLAQGDSAVDEN